MRNWFGLAGGLVVAAIVFQVGYLRGQGDCAASARVQQEREQAIIRDVAAAFEAPTGRELACDRIFDMVADGLDQEALDEQAERARQPDP